MNAFRIFFALIAIALIAAAGWFGRVVPMAEQWPMFEALRTTASIIFAVIGAWMAIIYPDRLKLSFKPQQPGAASSATGLNQLFLPVVHSTAILSVILVLGVSVPILKRQEFAVDIAVLRGLSYGTLATLTIWQLWTVLLTLVPADKVKTYLDHEDSRALTIEGVKAVGMRRPKSDRPLPEPPVAD